MPSMPWPAHRLKGRSGSFDMACIRVLLLLQAHAAAAASPSAGWALVLALFIIPDQLVKRLLGGGSHFGKARLAQAPARCPRASAVLTRARLLTAQVYGNTVVYRWAAAALGASSILVVFLAGVAGYTLTLEGVRVASELGLFGSGAVTAVSPDRGGHPKWETAPSPPHPSRSAAGAAGLGASVRRRADLHARAGGQGPDADGPRRPSGLTLGLFRGNFIELFQLVSKYYIFIA